MLIANAFQRSLSRVPRVFRPRQSTTTTPTSVGPRTSHLTITCACIRPKQSRLQHRQDGGKDMGIVPGNLGNRKPAETPLEEQVRRHFAARRIWRSL